MKVDLDQKLTFPPEVITTSVRLDLVLWSASQKAAEQSSNWLWLKRKDKNWAAR